jgi:hypothetical protein
MVRQYREFRRGLQGRRGPAGVGDRRADRADRPGADVNDGTLGNWVAAARRAGDADQGALSEDERAALARLRRENA